MLDRNVIPKIIHFCWLSGEPYPEKVARCIDSWKRILPEYEIILWNKDNFTITSVPWVKNACFAKKYAFAADYIRFYVLYNFGGIYLDSDVEVLKSFDEFLTNDYFFGFEYSGQVEAAVVGAKKGLDWIKESIEWYNTHDFYDFISNNKQIVCPTIMRYGFEKINRVQLVDVCEKQYIKNGVVLPFDYFSPKNGFNGEIILSPNTHTIHHFNAGWISSVNVSLKIKRFIHLALIKVLGRKLYIKIIYSVRKILHKV